MHTQNTKKASNHHRVTVIKLFLFLYKVINERVISSFLCFYSFFLDEKSWFIMEFYSLETNPVPEIKLVTVKVAAFEYDIYKKKKRSNAYIWLFKEMEFSLN